MAAELAIPDAMDRIAVMLAGLRTLPETELRGCGLALRRQANRMANIAHQLAELRDKAEAL